MLIIFPGALGDLVCLIPAIRVISAQNPGCVIELMARMELARFGVGRIGIARAHSIDRPEVSHLFVTGSDYPEAVRAYFANFVRVYSFFAADNERFRIALAAVTREARFYPFRPPREGHIADAYWRLIGGHEGASREVSIELLAQDREAAAEILARDGLQPHSYVLILPGSGSRSKNWPAEKFVALAQRIAAKIKSLVVLGPAEENLEDTFRARGIATASGLELGEVAALAHQAKAFVGNDSGVAHLAAASGARGVALFGPTDPTRWRPQGRVEVMRYQPIAELPIDQVEAAIMMLVRIGE